MKVRISKEMLPYLDLLQGGKAINKKTGERDYTKLKAVLSQKPVQDLFDYAYQAWKKTGKIPAELKKAAYQNIPKDMLDHLGHAEGDSVGGEVLANVPPSVVGFMRSYQ